MMKTANDNLQNCTWCQKWWIPKRRMSLRWLFFTDGCILHFDSLGSLWFFFTFKKVAWLINKWSLLVLILLLALLWGLTQSEQRFLQFWVIRCLAELAHVVQYVLVSYIGKRNWFLQLYLREKLLIGCRKWWIGVMTIRLLIFFLLVLFLWMMFQFCFHFPGENDRFSILSVVMWMSSGFVSGFLMEMLIISVIMNNDKGIIWVLQLFFVDVLH